MNESTDKFLAIKADRTDNLWTRFRGLLGRKFLNDGEGMIMAPCKGVDTMFMRFAIDLVYVDKKGAVVKVKRNLRPWRISPYQMNARMVLELPVGSIDTTDTKIGDQIKIEGVE